MANRNGLVVDAALTHATGTAARDAASTMLDRRPGRHRFMLGADEPFDVEAFMGELRMRRLTPRIAIDGAVSETGKVRRTAVDGRASRRPGRAIGLRCRNRPEKVFDWIEVQAGLAEVKDRSLSEVEAVFTFAAVASNLVRLLRLPAVAAA